MNQYLHKTTGTIFLLLAFSIFLIGSLIKDQNLVITNRKLTSNNESPVQNQQKQQPVQIKAYSVWNRKDKSYCVAQGSSTKTQGIFFIKVPKTSSFMLALITNRIAAREARRRKFVVGTHCKTHEPTVHFPASTLKVGQRDKLQSFLWTMIRQPDTRAISHYGMHIAFGNWSDSTKEFVEKLKGNIFFRPHTQLWWIAPNFLKDDTSDIQLQSIIQDVLNQYNFIGVYERLYESIVVLGMLMDVNINDILYSWRPSKIARCGNSIKQPSWLTNDMKSHLATDEWKDKQKGDFMLYNAVNQKLDATIDLLGRDKVQQNVEKYNKLIQIGTNLSSKLLSRPGCGIDFKSDFYDISDLKNFNNGTISDEDKNFVMSGKEILI